MRLSSGLVIVGAYADKIRRTLFAQLKDKIKSKELDPKDVAKASADLNKLLYEIFVNRLKLDKGDVVRIIVDYDVVDNEVRWNLESLKIEVFKRVPEDEYIEVVNEAVSKIEELEEIEEVSFSVEKAGETDLGDVVYFVKVNEELAGALVITVLNGEGIVRGAVTRPNPIVIERTRIEIREDLEEVLTRLIEESGKEVDEEIASKMFEEIRSTVRAREEMEEVKREVEITVEKAGETDLGDTVYYVKVDDEIAGALVITPLNDEGVVRGAVAEPDPILIEKTRIEIGEDLEDELIRLIKEKGKSVRRETAIRMIDEIRERIK